MSEIVKKSLITTIINILGSIIGVISVLYFQTKYLSSEELGEIALIHSKGGFIVLFIQFNLSGVITKFYANVENDNILYSSLLTISILFPIISTIILLLLYLLVFQNHYVIQHYMAVFIYGVSMTLLSHLFSYLTIRKKIVFYNFMINVFQKLFFIIIIYFYFIKTISFQNVIYLYILSFSFIGLAIGIQYYRNINFKFTINLKLLKTELFKKEIIRFIIFSFLMGISGVIVRELDIIMLESYSHNTKYSGIYKISLYFTSFFFLIKNPLYSMISPMISKYTLNNDILSLEKVYKRSSINMLIPSLLLFVLIFININDIYNILPNGQEYKLGINVAFILSLTYLIDNMTGANGYIIAYSKYYHWTLYLSIFLLIISIFLNLYFIPKYMLNGAAYATFISILSYNLFFFILVRIKFGIQPFSKHTIYVLILGSILLIVFYNINIIYPILNIIIKSIMVTLIYVFIIYKLKSSEFINNLIDNILLRIKNIIFFLK